MIFADYQAPTPLRDVAEPQVPGGVPGPALALTDETAVGMVDRLSEDEFNFRGAFPKLPFNKLEITKASLNGAAQSIRLIA